MSSHTKEETKKELPEYITDPGTGKTYLRGKFLGKGGFARCYELTETTTKAVFAGKIVSKSLLIKPHQKEKMSQEIAIHRSLKHHHIVGFHSFFEDSENVYIILELCRRRSMMELHKRRKALTEPEARYFMLHLLNGVKHLHDSRVIHRDLKLGNLFLNDEMQVKIGDFGLATRIDFDGERKKTLCGTPNYIAPEILSKKGHSFEVDIWSIGCILFTLLVGKPPFETQTLKDTYMRIKRNEYHVPSRLSCSAKVLIKRLLHADPSQRPNAQQILNDDFMTNGYRPTRLPTSCLTMAPRYDARHMQVGSNSRRPLGELNNKDGNSPMKVGGNGGAATATGKRYAQDAKATAPAPGPEDCHLKDLFSQVSSVVASNPEDKKNVNEDETEDPAAVPMIWISKWVDYSDKYGLGYQLCDDSIGVLFNDFTKLQLLPDGENIQYIERNLTEHYHTLSVYPETLYKKVTLLRYFRNYMNEHLLKAGATMCPREGDELVRIPSLRTYFRTRSAIVLHLTNGTLQMNFFEDHTKIILCPLMGAVTYIDEKKNFRTFKLDRIQQHGCNADLASRLKYACNMMQKMMLTRYTSESVSSSSAAAPSKSSKTAPQPVA
uniref:Serine/threonine-protein kinase PLK n=2 Tax=Hirondellea gigas TaxID=1518452 RepID=A0A6A7G3C6_9CRUS